MRHEDELLDSFEHLFVYENALIFALAQFNLLLNLGQPRAVDTLDDCEKVNLVICFSGSSGK